MAETIEDRAFARLMDAETVERAAADLEHAIDELLLIKGATRVVGTLRRLREQLDKKAARIRGER